MCGRSLHGNREISGLTRAARRRWSASGRRVTDVPTAICRDRRGGETRTAADCRRLHNSRNAARVTEMPAVVAFNAGNLRAVARTLRHLHPDRIIYIAGDNDQRQEAKGEPHRCREKAAVAVGSFMLLPDFVRQEAGSDWNDLLIKERRDTAQQRLRNGFPVAALEQMLLNRAAAGEVTPDLSHAAAPVSSRGSAQANELER
jgi:Toprim domain